jgi:hypothetical protein
VSSARVEVLGSGMSIYCICEVEFVRCDEMYRFVSTSDSYRRVDDDPAVQDTKSDIRVGVSCDLHPMICCVLYYDVITSFFTFSYWNRITWSAFAKGTTLHRD